MDQTKLKELQVLACKARIGIVNAVHSAKSGHPGGSLSIADTLTYLYHCVMRHDPKIRIGTIAIVLFYRKDTVRRRFTPCLQTRAIFRWRIF